MSGEDRSGDMHGQTWGEAADEKIVEGVERLETLTETEGELKDSIEKAGSVEAAILKLLLARVRYERKELEEATFSLMDQREKDPFERLSDEQLETFREMYGSVIPDE